MLKYIVYENTIGNTAVVRAIYHNPIPEFERENGIYLDSTVPNAETVEGMYPVLMVKLDAKELFYNYESLPELPIPDEVLLDRATNIESDLGSLLLESAADKATIATLEDTLGNLLLEVAALKGGDE
ncbi:hypothetical protein ACE3MQ_06370 [Paenibacillus lentus]|uniref:hypothetical protein n=1 Tax=Paenibacillus lentus TaxID=1338368 RepID=UPI00364B44E7